MGKAKPKPTRLRPYWSWLGYWPLILELILASAWIYVDHNAQAINDWDYYHNPQYTAGFFGYAFSLSVGIGFWQLVVGICAGFIPRVRRRALTLGIIAVIMLAQVGYSLVEAAASDAQSKTDAAIWAQKQREIVHNYDFQVYVPQYMPETLHLSSAGNVDVYEPLDEYGAHYFTLRYDRSGSTLIINIFKIPSSYRPPASCGSETPPTTYGSKLACDRLVATSKFGTAVYYSQKPSPVYTTTIGSSEIVVQTDQNDLVVKSDATLMKIINSLAPKTADELAALLPKR